MGKARRLREQRRAAEARLPENLPGGNVTIDVAELLRHLERLGLVVYDVDRTNADIESARTTEVELLDAANAGATSLTISRGHTIDLTGTDPDHFAEILAEEIGPTEDWWTTAVPFVEGEAVVETMPALAGLWIAMHETATPFPVDEVLGHFTLHELTEQIIPFRSPRQAAFRPIMGDLLARASA